MQGFRQGRPRISEVSEVCCRRWRVAGIWCQTLVAQECARPCTTVSKVLRKESFVWKMPLLHSCRKNACKWLHACMHSHTILTCAHAHTLTHTHTLTLTLTLTLTHSLTHSHSLSHTQTHTHTHISDLELGLGTFSVIE